MIADIAGNRIKELERELAAASIKSTNRCTHFVFNPMDALGLVTEYAPRKERDWKENQGRLPI